MNMLQFNVVQKITKTLLFKLKTNFAAAACMQTAKIKNWNSDYIIFDISLQFTVELLIRGKISYLNKVNGECKLLP